MHDYDTLAAASNTQNEICLACTAQLKQTLSRASQIYCHRHNWEKDIIDKMHMIMMTLRLTKNLTENQK